MTCIEHPILVAASPALSKSMRLTPFVVDRRIDISFKSGLQLNSDFEPLSSLTLPASLLIVIQRIECFA